MELGTNVKKIKKNKDKCIGVDGSITCQKIDYELFYWSRLESVAVAQFSILGIDNMYVDSTTISRMLYSYGAVVFFFDEAIGDFLVLPCTIDRVGIAGIPSRVKAYSPYTTYNRYLDLGEGDDFYVCFDSQTYMRAQYYFFPWVSQLAEISVSIDVNLWAQRTPVIGVSSLEERLSMENIMEEYRRGAPLIELKKKKGANGEQIDLSKQLHTLDLSAPYLVDKLELERKNVWNHVLETLGYKVNVNASKKERLITDEVRGNLEETIGFYESRRKPREGAVKWLRKHGLDASLQEVTSVETSDVGNMLDVTGADTREVSASE